MSVGLFSWGAETTGDYHERSRVMGSIQIANSLGTVLVLLVPTAIEWLADAEDLGTERVRAMGCLILALLPLTVLFSWIYGPESKVMEGKKRKQAPLWAALKHALAQKPLRMLLVADLAIGINLGIGTSVSVFFVEIVLGLEGRIGTVQLASLLAGLAGIPLWVLLARVLEKHRALAATAFISVLGGFFALLVPPNQFLLYFLASITLGVGLGGIQFLPRSIMADVLDGDRLDSGEERAGLYYSFLTSTLKIGLAIGIAASFYVAGYFEFDPADALASTDAHYVIRYLTGWSSVALGLVIIVMSWRFPIGRQQQEAMQSAIIGN
ncbi:MAG: MFS transporter, partial [Gammaproteobacteria bacterium]|nr:MFS transporter [Gammaproteobacteria bacterium]